MLAVSVIGKVISCPLSIFFISVDFVGLFRICGWMWQRKKFFLLLVVSWLCVQCHNCWFLFRFLHHICPWVLISVIQWLVHGNLSWPQFHLFVFQLIFCQGWFCVYFWLVWEIKWVGFLLNLSRCVLLFICLLVLII